MHPTFLTGRSVGISISDSPDLNVLGLSELHLRDVMVEVARHLLAAGASLVYGGDLRVHGFTRLLFEVVARHRKNRPEDKVPVTNYLAWPVYISLSRDELREQREQLGEAGSIVPLDVNGRELSNENDVSAVPVGSVSEREWEHGLTSMRQVAVSKVHAQVLLGGTTEGFRGRMPGVAEEALIAVKQKKPVFLVGGFGGCVADIAQDLELRHFNTVYTRTEWPAREQFRRLTSESLNNGLRRGELVELAHTVHTDEIIGLVLRGLHRVLASSA